MNYAVVIFLVILSGLFSGLTLGLLSLNVNRLKRKIALGDKDAEKVYSVRKRGNLLLCTLLLGNVGVNSAIAVFLSDIASGLVAGLVSTGLIVIFGEIIPQASFARHALWVGARTAWLVKIFMFILLPICWPIAWILDKVLGEELPTIYSKKELMKIIEEHEDVQDSEIDEDEERIIKGALSYSDKEVIHVMTPRTVIFALEAKDVLNEKLLNEIKEEGFTRIPVYRGTIDKTIGVLYAKDLINIKFDMKVEDLCKKEKFLTVPSKLKLDELLTMFIKSKNHLAFVKNEYHGLQGVVTLEDIIEEIIKQEIVDETDKVTDLQEKARNGIN